MSRLHPHPKRLQDSNGFTLVELAMVVAIGSIIMLGTASMLISHIRSSAKMEAVMRLQEAWSRIQFLLDQEIQEARVEATSPSAVSCTSLSLTIPNATGSDGSIVYSVSSSGLLNRTGPPVSSDGTLDFSATSSTATLMRSVRSFCPVVSDGRVTYTLALDDASGATYENQSQPSGARSRARIIE